MVQSGPWDVDNAFYMCGVLKDEKKSNIAEICLEPVPALQTLDSHDIHFSGLLRSKTLRVLTIHFYRLLLGHYTSTLSLSITLGNLPRLKILHLHYTSLTRKVSRSCFTWAICKFAVQLFPLKLPQCACPCHSKSFRADLRHIWPSLEIAYLNRTLKRIQPLQFWSSRVNIVRLVLYDISETKHTHTTHVTLIGSCLWMLACQRCLVSWVSLRLEVAIVPSACWTTLADLQASITHGLSLGPCPKYLAMKFRTNQCKVNRVLERQ